MSFHQDRGHYAKSFPLARSVTSTKLVLGGNLETPQDLLLFPTSLLRLPSSEESHQHVSTDDLQSTFESRDEFEST
ncbi:hypothetical protein VN97_g4570 [Penicillium thymicola]|uniref:Uncharacterized protein n=1 Tax=Penicillium thymicola TaxID=293382 RepID=A0AAI9TKC3_PENTH|nr:hypothetical protein VN97_g4570 [Penicillium thymicola]